EFVGRGGLSSNDGIGAVRSSHLPRDAPSNALWSALVCKYIAALPAPKPSPRKSVVRLGEWTPDATRSCHMLTAPTDPATPNIRCCRSSDSTRPPLLSTSACQHQSAAPAPTQAMSTPNLPVFCFICRPFCFTCAQVVGGLSGSSPACRNRSA